MYNASPELITAIKQPYRIVSCKVNFGTYINLTDEEIISIDITSNLCPSNEFEIGIAPMSTATIEIKWSEDVDYNYENQKADILFGLELPDATVEYVPMGKYTVEKATVSKRNLTLELVDNMHKAERDFTGTITFPSTVKTIVDSACSQSGLTLATSSFANSNMVITEEMSFFNTTCRQVLAQAAELAGGWAVINRSGQLEIITLGGTSLRQITSNQYFEFNVDEVANSHIDKVVVNVGEESASAGTGADIYHVVNNIFVQDPTLPVTALYNVVNGTYYIAGSLSWQGDFTLDLGDRVTVEGEPFYIMNRNLSYSGGISERTESPAVSNILKDTTVRGSLSLALAETLTEFKIMDGKIEATVSKADEAYTTANGAASTASSAYSKATQTADGFANIVERVDTVEGTANGAASTASSAYSKATQTADGFANIVERVDTVEGTANGAASTASSAYSKATQTASQVQTVVNRVDTIDGDIVTMNSSISQNANSITLKVSKNGVISSINQSTETISINASKINLTGYVTVSSLGQYGSTTIHGNRIETGTITANKIAANAITADKFASIAGFTFSNSAMSVANSGSYVRISGASGFHPIIVGPSSSDIRFRVGTDGDLLAKSADISGKITATSGKIGGFTLANNTMTGDNSGNYVRISGASGFVPIRVGPSSSDIRFQVDVSGDLTATGADISGKITATSGKIGGFTIGNSTLTASNSGSYVRISGASGFHPILVGPSSSDISFRVGTDGDLLAKSVTVTGNITANSNSTLGGSLNSTSGTHSGALYYTSGRHSGTHYGYHNGEVVSSSGTLGAVTYSAANAGMLTLSGGIFANAASRINGALSVMTSSGGYSNISGGTIYGYDFITRTSDIYYKEKLHQNNAKQISNEIYDLDIVEFTYKTSQKEDIGVIANEMLTKQPMLAKHVVCVNDDNRLGVNYTKINTASLYAIQDLNKRLEKLERAMA